MITWILGVCVSRSTSRLSSIFYMLCYDKRIFNTFWQRLSEKDFKNSEVLRIKISEAGVFDSTDFNGSTENCMYRMEKG